MEYSRKTMAVSSGDHKLAALFFDQILPLHSFDEVPLSIKFEIDRIYRSSQAELFGAFKDLVFSLPEDFRTFCRFKSKLRPEIGQKRIEDMIPIMDEFKQEIEQVMGIPQNSIRGVSATIGSEKLSFEEIEKRMLSESYVQRDSFAISIATDLREVFNDYFLVPYLRLWQPNELSLNEEKNIDACCIELLLENVKLVDSSCLDWNQVVDFRKDEDSKNKLARLRMYMYDNYRDKSIDYIKDSLNLKIYEYEQVCSKHGFKIANSTFSTFLDSKSIQGIMWITAAGLLSGNAAAATAAALSGAGIELGKIVFKVLEVKNEFANIRDEHPLAYLFKIKEQIGQ